MEFKRPIFGMITVLGKIIHFTPHNFFEYPHLFRLEMKYYLATRLLRKTLNPSSLWSDYQFMLKKFVCFLQEAYPQINSFSEISIVEMFPHGSIM